MKVKEEKKEKNSAHVHNLRIFMLETTKWTRSQEIKIKKFEFVRENESRSFGIRRMCVIMGMQVNLLDEKIYNTQNLFSVC